MAIKYWEFEDAPLKEKLKNVNIREIAKIFFDNETEAYRFAYLLLEVKKKKGLRLKDVDKGIPISTAKRYLDFAVSAGMLKHEGNVYMLTDRFSRPFRNIATYVKAWMDVEAEEDLDVEFPNARRGARKMPETPTVVGPDAETKTEENGSDTNSEGEKAGT
jgi:hypothetical protein